MDEPFLIPVAYRGKEYELEAQLFTTTYQYRIEVLIDEVPISFEKDDEGNFRAIAVKPDDSRLHKTDPAFIQAVAQAIDAILS